MISNELRRLEAFVDDRAFLARVADIRHANKKDLCKIVRDQTGIRLDPARAI